MTFVSSDNNHSGSGGGEKRKSGGGGGGDPCRLCGRNSDSLELLELLSEDQSSLRAHYACLLFSSGLGQSGSEGQGLKGFLPADIHREIKRGSRLKCHYCKGRGATVGCAKPSCKKSYHLPCGIQHDSLQQHFQQFKSYCSAHRPQQKIPKRASHAAPGADQCPLCPDRVFKKPIPGSLWAPCCSSWFHRVCVQKYALSDKRQVHYPCPQCENPTFFLPEMRNFGIYFPTKANHHPSSIPFEGTTTVCAAKLCFCDKVSGRNTDESSILDSPWGIILCFSCQSRGIHLKCGGMDEYVEPSWHCYSCRRRDSVEPDENAALKRLKESSPIKEVWGYAKAKKLLTHNPPTSNQSTNNAKDLLIQQMVNAPPVVPTTEESVSRKRKFEDPMKLSLEDIIVEGLNSKSNRSLPPRSKIVIKSSVNPPPNPPSSLDEGTSPGDSDYESEPPQSVSPIINDKKESKQQLVSAANIINVSNKDGLSMDQIPLHLRKVLVTKKNVHHSGHK